MNWENLTMSLLIAYVSVMFGCENFHNTEMFLI